MASADPARPERKSCDGRLPYMTRYGWRTFVCDREAGHSGACAAFKPNKTVVWRRDD